MIFVYNAINSSFVYILNFNVIFNKSKNSVVGFFAGFCHNTMDIMI